MPDTPKQQKLRLKDKRQRLMWVKVAAGASVTAIAILLVWYLARIPALTIAKVEVSGTASVDGKSVESTVASALSGSYFFFIPRNNSLIFPRDAVTAAIVNAFPEISDVLVTRDGWNALSILVSERAPVALWCEGLPRLRGQAAQAGTPENGGACYLMDMSGYVFAKSADADLYLRFYGGVSGKPIGQTYISGDFGSLKHFVEEVSSTVRGTPESVFVEEGGDVSIAFVQGGVLQFVRGADRAALLDNIASVFSARGLIPNQTLEYADFRFGDKVYVKFRER